MWLLLFQDRGAAFLASLLTGVIIGVVYDVFRVGRVVTGGGRIKLFFEDVLFFLMAALVFCVFIFNATMGVIRMFASVGVLLGFFAYRFSLGLFTVYATRHIKAWLTPPIMQAKSVMRTKIVQFMAKRYTVMQSQKTYRKACVGFA